MPAKPAPVQARRSLLSRKSWQLIGIAFAAGVLLFVLLWSRQRSQDDFYRVDAASAIAVQPFDALPAPVAGPGGSDATGRVQPGEASAPLPQRPAAPAPTAAAPVVQQPAPGPGPYRGPDAYPPPPASSGMSGDGPPLPTSSPPPSYPPAALRNGDGGTVVLQVLVGADGVPTRVDVTGTSRVRALDRAAVEAVERWRFRPARRAGQAVPGEVRVPISFNASR